MKKPPPGLFCYLYKNLLGMKLLKITILLFVISCKAQSPEIPLLDITTNYVAGAWYKDIDNEFLKFTGTWKYEDTTTNTSFTITLQKKTAFYSVVDNYYEDIIIGEYKFIQNGVEVVNTLPNLSVAYTNEFFYNIAGGLIIDIYSTTAGNRPLKFRFNDPERDYLNVSMRVYYIAPQGSMPAKIKIEWTGASSWLPDDNSPTDIRVPTAQEYILTKQP